MLKIAVCDDEKETAAGLESLLRDICGSRKLPCAITVYHSAQELRTALQTGAQYDLIYLDISFAKGEINGVEAGRFIRETLGNHTVSIVYISKVHRYAQQLVHLNVQDLLIKPLTRSDVEKSVQIFLKRSAWDEEGAGGEFTYKKGQTAFTIPLKEVRYFENQGRKVIMHLSGGSSDEFYGALKDIYEEQLKERDFLFIHASYLVNFDYVSASGYKYLRLSGSEFPLPIAKQRRNEIRQRSINITVRRGLG